LEGGIDRDGEADRFTDDLGQCLGDGHSCAGLKEILGEIARDGEQDGAVDDTERTGQADEGELGSADLSPGGEQVDRPCPALGDRFVLRQLSPPGRVRSASPSTRLKTAVSHDSASSTQLSTSVGKSSPRRTREIVRLCWHTRGRASRDG